MTVEALGVEIALRKTKDSVTGSLTLFHQHFDGYDIPEALGPGWEINGLPIHRFVQREAVFDGGEIEVKWRVWEEGKTRWLDWSASLDWVRATDVTKNSPLPRIPPMRVGTRAELGWDAWTLGFESSTVIGLRVAKIAMGGP